MPARVDVVGNTWVSAVREFSAAGDIPMKVDWSFGRVAPGRQRAGTYILTAIVGIFLMMAGLEVAIPQELGALERALQASGYQLYNPSRANWGPGFVFAGDVVDGRITNVEEVCPNLYADGGSSPQNAAVVLADYTASNAFTFQLTIEFLKKLLGDSLNLGPVTTERMVEVKWTKVREMSYTHMDQWLKTGEPRPVAKACRLAIEDLKAKGKFKDRIFVVVRALAPEVLVYDFKGAAAVDANGSAAFFKNLKAAAQGKGEIKNGTVLEITKPLFIGYAPPVKIEDWLPMHLVSGEIVEVRGSNTDLILK